MAPSMAKYDATGSGPPEGFKAKQALLEAFMRRDSMESDVVVVGTSNGHGSDGHRATGSSGHEANAEAEAAPLLAAHTRPQGDGGYSSAAAGKVAHNTVALNHRRLERSASSSSTSLSRSDQQTQPQRSQGSQQVSLPAFGTTSESVVSPLQWTGLDLQGQDSAASTNSPRSSLGDVSTLMSCGSTTPTQGLAAVMPPQQGEKRPTAWQRRNLEEEIKGLQADLVQSRTRELDQAKLNQRLQHENEKIMKELEAYRNREGLLQTLGGSPVLHPISSFQSSLDSSGRESRRGKICRGVCRVFGRR